MRYKHPHFWIDTRMVHNHRAYVTFIGIIQYDIAFEIKSFKFLQLFFLVCERYGEGDLRACTLISCTNASKKGLKVMSLVSLPVAFCQASRDFETLWRSSVAVSSSEQSIIGFLPCPVRVSKPLMLFLCNVLSISIPLVQLPLVARLSGRLTSLQISAIWICIWYDIYELGHCKIAFL